MLAVVNLQFIVRLNRAKVDGKLIGAIIVVVAIVSLSFGDMQGKNKN